MKKLPKGVCRASSKMLKLNSQYEAVKGLFEDYHNKFFKLKRTTCLEGKGLKLQVIVVTDVLLQFKNSPELLVVNKLNMYNVIPNYEIILDEVIPINILQKHYQQIDKESLRKLPIICSFLDNIYSFIQL